MKHLSIIAAVMALAAIPTFAADNDNTRRSGQDRINRAERRENRQDIEQLIKEINSLDNQPTARRAGIAEAARQAGVPEARLQSPPKEHPNVGLAGLFLAHEIAKNSKKSAQDLLDTRVGGESWTQIAEKNKQDLTALETKLTRIHEAMLDPNGDRARASTANPVGSVSQTTTVGAEPAFDKSIQSVNALGQEQEARRLGLDAIARETGLSRQQVEQAADQNKQMGLGDLFVAQQLALQTKKPVNEMWNMHLSPKTWADIARENNRNASQLETQLARVESAMRGQTARVEGAERVRALDSSRTDSTAAFNETAFQQSIQSVNSLGQDTKARTAGLMALSRETAMPLSQIEQTSQQNQGLGIGDLFVAQELSVKTKKSVDELWKQHLNAKTWAQIARDNNQDIGEIQRKLARIEQELRNAGK
jgi:hypothetical protein